MTSSRPTITTIILTYNEELHIRRCIENVLELSDKIYVVDCFSSDGTCDICRGYEKVEVVRHQWPGNQAEQFNWALDNIQIDTEWILRLDADEYLTEELIAEIESRLSVLPSSITAVLFPCVVNFLGRTIRHGANGVKMIRLFRYGKARYGKSLMDERLLLQDGEEVEFSNSFIDDNLNGLKFFIEKHNGYSSREAYQMLDAEYGLHHVETSMNLKCCTENRKKLKQKYHYSRMPLFWRCFVYFFYRYFVKCGFLDGTAGFLRDFFQCLWYRMLVDAKIYEVKKNCGSDREKIISYFEKYYGFSINNR